MLNKKPVTTGKSDPSSIVQQEQTVPNSGPKMVVKWRNAAGWPLEHTSTSATDWLGFSQEHLRSETVSYAELIHPEDLNRFTDEVERNSADPAIESFAQAPYRLRNRAGSYLQVLDNTRIVRDASGKISHYESTLTELSQGDKESAFDDVDFIHALVNSSHDPIHAISISDGYRMVYANKAAERHFGMPLEEILKLRVQDFDPNFDPDQLDALANRLRNSSEPVTFETQHIRGDGSLIDAEVSISIIEHRGKEYSVGYMQDISERKTREKQILDSESQLAAIFENSNVGIMFINGPRIFVKGNQRLADILGYSTPEAMVGLSMRSLHLNEQRFREFGQAHYQALCNRDVLQLEYQLRHKDGSPVWCSLSGRALDRHHPADLSLGVVWIVDDIEKRKHFEEELITKEALIHTIFDNFPYLAWMKDTQGKYLMANQAVADLAKLPAAEIVGKTDFDIWPHSLAELYMCDDQEILQSDGGSIQREEQIETPEGRRWFETYKSPMLNAQGQLMGTLGMARDVTQRIETEQALLRAEEQAHLLLAHSNEGIFGLDNDGITTFVNPAAARMLGYETHELIGRANHAAIHHSHRDGEPIPDHQCRMSLAAKQNRDYHVSDEVLWRKDGSHFPVEYWSTPIFREGAVVGTVVTFHDISVRERNEHKIRHLAYHDPLTGLPNRRLFLDVMLTELGNAKRYSNNFAVLLIDLDHFKEVNDTLGHPAGDQLLCEVAKRIQSRIRVGDTCARLGGDEFIILAPNIEDELDTASMASAILDLLKQPFRINDRELVSGCSIGIVICNRFNASVDQIISRGDIALYRAKAKGRGNYVFYEEGMTERVREESEIAQQIVKAIDNGEFRLVLQPKIQLSSGTHQGFEALLRWESPTLGTVSPGLFIPIAERRRLIAPITRWVVSEVSRIIQQAVADQLPVGQIAFNLSALELSDPVHLAALGDQLLDSGIDLSDFQLELTETAYAEAPTEALRVIDRLHDKRLTVAIDDFGTGYSSMVSLRKIRATYLKIDHSFIRDMTFDKDDRAIVQATVNLAHSLGMQVIAEGVETAEQEQLLIGMGCELAQGYFFARPLEIDQAWDYLKKVKGANETVELPRLAK